MRLETGWQQARATLEMLTHPSAQLADVESRARARMLAAITGALVVGGAVLFAIWIMLLPDYEENRFIALFTMALLGGIYALSRTRFYLWGARLLVITILLLITTTIFTAPGSPVEQMQTLYFLLLAVMFAYFFFGWVALALTWAGTLGILIWFFSTRPVPTPLMYSFFVFFVIAALLGAVFTVLNQAYRAQLTQSEERYRSVVSVLSEGIVVHATDGTIVASNAAAAQILGLTEDQLHGRNSLDPRWRAIREDGTPFAGPDHPAMVTLRTGQPQFDVVMGVHQPHGELRWLSITSKPLTMGKGVVVSFADITERRRAEQALQQFVDDMRALQYLHLELTEISDLDTLQRQMVVLSRQRLGLDRVGLFLLSDDGTRLLGTYGTDTAGALRDERYYSELITPDHWTLLIAEAREYVQLQDDATLYDNGAPVGVGWSAQAALWNGQRSIGYLVVDNLMSQRPPRLYERELLSILGSTFGHLIERKRNELALINSEQRLRALLNALPDLVLRLNAEGVYLDLHASNDSDLVAPRDQIIGHRIDELLPPDVSGMLMRALGQVIQYGGEEILEYTLRINGVLKDYEARIVASQPGEALTIVRNVTERKHAQQRELDLILAKERVRLLRQFIEKASHEFRTPLAIINSSAYLMTRMDDPVRREERAAIIQQQVSRLTKMVEMLFFLARLESGITLEFKPTDLAVLVTNVCQAVISAHGGVPSLTLEVDEGLPLVLANAEYLQQALLQILDNAYRFTPPDGSIRVHVTWAGPHACVEVHDTGAGIQREHLPLIFDTFWQQNSTDATPGLGIGLSIARRVIDMHGGYIEVDSVVSVGTAMRLWLPVMVTRDAG